MKIACWNVNSIRARLARLVEFLNKQQPDIVCLQETKCDDATFPFEAVGDAGYEVAHHGQRTYNGVAILSKLRPIEVVKGFADGQPEDGQSRLIWARFDGVSVCSAYCPNGQSVGSDKYAYKLQWFERLAAVMHAKAADPTPLLVCGDYNVAPEDVDVHDPIAWQDQVLCSQPERAAFRKLLDAGYTDAFRALRPHDVVYTWWDYRMLGFAKNRGLRIDHMLVNAPALARCKTIAVDRDMRKGQDPSDHAPVVIELT